MPASNVLPLAPRRVDPVLLRELRRYRALGAIGGRDGLCESCSRLVWHRAGAEDLADAPPHPDPAIAAALGDKLPDYLPDIAAALGAEARVLDEMAGRRNLNENDRARMRLLTARLVRVARFFNGRR